MGSCTSQCCTPAGVAHRKSTTKSNRHRNKSAIMIIDQERYRQSAAGDQSFDLGNNSSIIIYHNPMDAELEASYGQFYSSIDSLGALASAGLKKGKSIMGLLRRQSYQKGSTQGAPADLALMKKKNKHLFLKDYSKFSLQTFVLDGVRQLPKVSILVEYRNFYQKLKTSNEEKLLHIHKRIQCLASPQQLMMVGNKLVRVGNSDFACNNNNSDSFKKYEKFVIEIQYAVFPESLSKRQKPVVIVSQPLSSCPKEFSQIFDLKYSSTHLRKKDTFSMIELPTTTNTQSQKSKKGKQQSNHGRHDTAQSAADLIVPIREERRDDSSDQYSSSHQSIIMNSAFNTVIERNNNDCGLFNENPTIVPAEVDMIFQQEQQEDQSQLARPVVLSQTSKISQLAKETLEIVNDELVFETSQVMRDGQKAGRASSRSMRKHKKTPQEEVIQIFEAFVLYYESKEYDKKDKSFSIEIKIEEKNQKQPVGKKQTFMLGQFKNGQIFEREIQFGDYSHCILLPKKTATASSAKVFVKIQTFANELDKLNDALANLELKEKALAREIERIDHTIESIRLQKYESSTAKMQPASNNDTPVSRTATATATGSKDKGTNSSDKKDGVKVSKFDEHLESRGSSVYNMKVDDHSLRVDRHSQKAGFYQCQLMFMDGGHPQKEELKEDNHMYSLLQHNQLARDEDYKRYSETESNEQIDESADENQMQSFKKKIVSDKTSCRKQ